jgi:hypothetical protein
VNQVASVLSGKLMPDLILGTKVSEQLFQITVCKVCNCDQNVFGHQKINLSELIGRPAPVNEREVGNQVHMVLKTFNQGVKRGRTYLFFNERVEIKNRI